MSRPRINQKEYYIRLLVIILAALTPAIFFITQGHKPSLSTYWETPMQPLFIFANATTSYYLFGLKFWWRLSAMFLLLLTAFSVADFPDAHNVIAALFFLSSLIALYQSNHFTGFFWAYLLSLLIMPMDMMLSESIAIVMLCAFHWSVLKRFYRTQKRRML